MVQNIGIDIGRGFVKGFTVVDGIERTCLFRSYVGLGRNLDFENYDNPIYISIEGDELFEDVFVGDLAMNEGYTSIANSKDSKVTDTCKKLLYGVINELATDSKVNIMLGVPNRMFKKSVLQEVTDAYKGKSVKITNKVTNEVKKITINEIMIYRESDSALLNEVTTTKLNNGKDYCLVSIGFRTTEITIFDSNLKFNDKKSRSIELGNADILEYVMKKNTSRDLHEIDASHRYNQDKEIGYKMVSEKLEQEIERIIKNIDETNVYIAGGIANKLNLDDRFKLVDNAQLVTAKGLYYLAKSRFK